MSRQTISAYVKNLEAQIAAARAAFAQAQTEANNAEAVLTGLLNARNLLLPDAGQRKRRAKKVETCAFAEGS